MISKLKLSLLKNSSERGAILPIVLGFGAITVMVGGMMIARSQGDQETAEAQTQTVQGMAATEAGVTQSLSKLNQIQNSFYLAKSYDPDGLLGGVINDWSGASAADSPDPCGSATGGQTPITYADLTASTDLTTDPDAPNYTIKAYRYDSSTETGTFVIEGNQGNATSRVQVSANIGSRMIPNSFPGLYASSIINLGNNDIKDPDGSDENGDGYVDDTSSANVICTSCPPPDPALHCQANGQLSDDGIGHSLGGSAGAEVDGRSFFSEPQVPDVETPPAGAIALGDVNLSGSDTLTLPRPSDTASGGIYHYTANSIKAGGSSLITIDTSSNPVYIYLTGSTPFGDAANSASEITVDIGSGIEHAGNSGDFRIYGTPDNGDSTYNQHIKIKGGGSATQVFIYAPDARIGISGGSGANDIVGAVWVKQWDGSSGTGAQLKIPDDIDSQLGGDYLNAGVQVTNTSSPNTWQRRAVE